MSLESWNGARFDVSYAAKAKRLRTFVFISRAIFVMPGDLPQRRRRFGPFPFSTR